MIVQTQVYRNYPAVIRKKEQGRTVSLRSFCIVCRTNGFEGIEISANLMVQDLVSMVDAQELPIRTVEFCS